MEVDFSLNEAALATGENPRAELFCLSVIS